MEFKWLLRMNKKRRVEDVKPILRIDFKAELLEDKAEEMIASSSSSGVGDNDYN